ncbi:MAG TPA: winged helix-turn-helix domain-containing protein [Nitrosopumilaceae archaeon]|nr:winged helix-turn-helix domain-containing protein [Nitrosopumilaceae archaeon]
MIDKMKISQRRERRNKLEIYFDILNSIMQEGKSTSIVRPTRVQFLSNLSYDGLLKHLEELKEKNLISIANGIFLTDRGKKFLKDYERIHDFTERMGLEYL